MPWGLTSQGEGEPQSLHFLEPVAIFARRSGFTPGLACSGAACLGPTDQSQLSEKVGVKHGAETREATWRHPGQVLGVAGQGLGAQRMQGPQDKPALPRSTLWREALNGGVWVAEAGRPREVTVEHRQACCPANRWTP